MSFRRSAPPTDFDTTVPTPQDLIVRPCDLRHFDEMQRLLLDFNDPAASAAALAEHIRRIPVLRARVTASLVQTLGATRIPPLKEQVARLGNREIEVLLLAFLEDLITLHCDLNDARHERCE